MILDDVGVTKKIWSDYILVTFWLHIMVYGYTESDVIAESRGWNAMSGDNDVVCVLWICVVVGTESYVCDQLPKLPEEPPPIGDCAGRIVQVAVLVPRVPNSLLSIRPHTLTTSYVQLYDTSVQLYK
jgi:hypothetical protein